MRKKNKTIGQKTRVNRPKKGQKEGMVGRSIIDQLIVLGKELNKVIDEIIKGRNEKAVKGWIPMEELKGVQKEMMDKIIEDGIAIRRRQYYKYRDKDVYVIDGKDYIIKESRIREMVLEGTKDGEIKVMKWTEFNGGIAKGEIGTVVEVEGKREGDKLQTGLHKWEDVKKEMKDGNKVVTDEFS